MQAVGADFEVLKRIADTENARVLFSYGTGDQEGAGRWSAKRLDELCEGRDITAISHVRGSGYMFGLQSGLPVRGQTWRDVSALDFEGRLAAINDPETAAKLIEEAKQPKATGIPMTDVFFLGAGETPDYTAPAENNLQAIADAAGEHWSETFCA